MIKILTADDHGVVREGLKNIFSQQHDMVVTGEASNAQEIFEICSKNEFDVVILDISMPGRSGLDIIHDLKNDFPRMRILILSMYQEEQYAFRAFKSGCEGYLTKDFEVEQLIDAIRKIASGGRYISPKLAEKLVLSLDEDFDTPVHEKLSNREFQVLCMIGSGLTVSQIADELSLSVNTISTNRKRILEKMSMKSNAELTYYTVKHNLVV